MCSSEIAKNKRSSLVSQFINILPGFLTRHGQKANILLLLSIFMLLLRTLKNKNSIFTKFYRFINTFTPRINLLEVGSAKKPFYIPLPPEKNNILRTTFLLNYLKLAKNGYSYLSLPNRLALSYKNSKKKTDTMSKKIEFIYRSAKQNKWRARKSYSGRMKNKNYNVVKKSKQFYL